uniref:Poly [ADP-ribose] polymerase n=1 Tax=Amphimedon queenslandica TaxID=400682 RepID=A0A1X7UIB7_AMPQE
MANVTGGRKRTRGAAKLSSEGEEGQVKKVKWEWLGDNGRWSQYADDVGETLTKSFMSGKDEITTSVARNVKMKIKFKDSMSQQNISTGWSRNIRCIGEANEGAEKALWEWEEGGVWKRFPDSTGRFLNAAKQLSLDTVSISLYGKDYTVNMKEDSMEDESNGDTVNIRQIQPTDAVWEWQDESSKWLPYSDTDTQSIEDAHAAGNASVTMTIMGRSYKIDFGKMEQVNVSTGVSRKIRRNIPAATSSVASVTSAVSASSTGSAGASNGKKREREEEKEDSVTSKKTKKMKVEKVEEVEEEAVKTKSTGEVKSHTFTGDAPVDSECKAKLGKAEVYSEGKEVWNCMLNQTNLKNNNNKFYLLQLLKDNGKKSYSVWFRWGRVGKAGQNDLFSFGGDLESAKNAFRKKFEDKTKNKWEERHSFVKVPGKYDMLEMDYGADEAQIKSGYAALKKIEGLIQSGKTSGDPLFKACDEFYTRVPHDFGMRRPPLITTREEIKQKLALLETHGKTHNTFKLEVEQIFEVKRDKEEENFKDVGNRQLLWHGSRLTNWVGILSQGLRIAPPEAPVTGYMFGKGVYFADMCSKSANYCFATRLRSEGLLLLSEVSLGTPNELLSADYNADKLPAGTQSVHGKGRMVPNPAYNHTLPDGCVVPLGTPIDTGLTNTGGYTLNYNEFIVYDTNQREGE